jgi:DNA recombination protein RmuC
MSQLWLIIGIAIGALGVWLALRARLAELVAARNARSEAERQIATLSATLEHERVAAAEKLQVVEQAQIKLTDSFKALASEALQSNNKAFVDLAKAELAQHQLQAREELEKRKVAMDALVKPITESLTSVDRKIEQLERERAQAHGALFNHLKTVTSQQEELKRETANLVTALRAPHTRGRWGEIQLRRVCEMAGMLKHCDFAEQETVSSDDGRLRPDVVVQLPGGKQVVIDAKVPLAAYLDAIDARDEETRKLHLQSHLRQVRDHIKKLAAKSYWDQFDDTPEFVVMFVDESMYRVALDEAPGLIEEAFEQHVLIATPASLLGLLRAVHYGWRQEKVAESAREIAELGKELHSRLGKFAATLAKIGRALGTSVNAYNEAVGSFDARVLVTARKLSEHGAASEAKELEQPAQVDVMPRAVQTETPQLEEGNADEIRIRRLGEAA